jgi:hypothetical protein
MSSCPNFNPEPCDRMWPEPCDRMEPEYSEYHHSSLICRYICGETIYVHDFSCKIYESLQMAFEMRLKGHFSLLASERYLFTP